MTRLERLYSPPEIGAPGKREARTRRRDLFYAGVFVLAMAAVAVAALAFAIPGLLGSNYRLRAYFLEARGLEEGVQVLQDGYVIGIVERVTPLFPGEGEAELCPKPAADAPGRSPILPCFRAILRIQDNWPVPADSVARLGSAGLLQGEALKVAPGTSPKPLADGAVIAAQGREGELVDRLGQLADGLDRVVNETVAPALESIKSQIQTVEKLLGTGEDQGENRERLAGAFENLRKLTGDLEQAVDPGTIGSILDSVERMSANLAQVSGKLTGSTQEVQRAVGTYADLAADIRGLVSENKPTLRRTLDDAQLVLADLSADLVPILANLEDATRNLAALARDLRQDPSTVIRGRRVEDKTPWFE